MLALIIKHTHIPSPYNGGSCKIQWYASSDCSDIKWKCEQYPISKQNTDGQCCNPIGYRYLGMTEGKVIFEHQGWEIEMKCALYESSYSGHIELSTPAHAPLTRILLLINMLWKLMNTGHKSQGEATKSLPLDSNSRFQESCRYPLWLHGHSSFSY